MVQHMFQEASIAGKFTNHSQYATGATTLFNADVPEAIIQKRSGHSSTKALCMHKQMTPQQDLAISKRLQREQKLSFKAAKQGIDVNKEDKDYDLSSLNRFGYF